MRDVTSLRKHDSWINNSNPQIIS